MHRTRRILSALGLTLALGATLPACLFTARGRFTTGAVVAYDQPPEPRMESPQPMAGHVWVRGNWTWQNNQWMWIDGHWERERAGYAWQQGEWQPRNGSWHWVGGQWTASGGGSGTIVTGNGAVIVDGHGHGQGPRDQVQDHRYPNNHGTPPVIVNNGPGPLVAGNGAGTVIVGNGGVTIIGPTAAPPPLRVESPGPNRKGYVWIEGAYQWSNNQYEWVSGHWERSKANHVWQPVRWELRGNVYIRIGGEWRIN